MFPVTQDTVQLSEKAAVNFPHTNLIYLLFLIETACVLCLLLSVSLSVTACVLCLLLSVSLSIQQTDVGLQTVKQLSDGTIPSSRLSSL